VNQSEILFAALKEAGVDATFFEVVGAGHGGPEFWGSEVQGVRLSPVPVVQAMVLAFFNQHLKSIL